MNLTSLLLGQEGVSPFDNGDFQDAMAHGRAVAARRPWDGPMEDVMVRGGNHPWFRHRRKTA